MVSIAIAMYIRYTNALLSKYNIMKNTKQLPNSGIRGKKGNHGIKLAAAQRKRLNTFVNSKANKTAAANEIGIDRNVLDRVQLMGSGSEETIKKIIAKL